MADPRCMTCKWCDIVSPDGGCCRYEPPKPFPLMGPQGQSATITVWPMVILAKDRCHNYEEQLVKPVGGRVIEMQARKP